MTSIKLYWCILFPFHGGNYLLHDPSHTLFVYLFQVSHFAFAHAPFPMSRRVSSLFRANSCHLSCAATTCRGNVTAWSVAPETSPTMSWISGNHFSTCLILDADLLQHARQRLTTRDEIHSRVGQVDARSSGATMQGLEKSQKRWTKLT